MRQTGGRQRFWRHWSRCVFPSLSLAALLLCPLSGQEVPVGASKPARPPESSDQEKLRKLDERFKGLEKECEELDRKVHGQLPGPDGSIMSVYDEWGNKVDALIFLHARISNLRTLGRLEKEVTALERRKAAKSETLHQLDVGWSAKQAELLESVKICRVEQRALELANDPLHGSASFVRASLKRRRLEKKDEGEIKKLRERLKKRNDRTDAIRTEARDLSARAASVRDEIVEIEASLWMARIDAKHLEDRRDVWDRDEPR